ncbi:hypothetical protein [Parabacteroides sp. FAFU027]|uniref:hypothetical protein n=1 Tax=Parabacteroides sp. FAFU027 TaxID=2922715 RepID=UPI001FAF7067|nr:hypothetical protein [Parabacteroides sp. FAFU027]
METQQKLRYWFEPDIRIEGLEGLFEGFDNSLKIFESKLNEFNWYDGDFFREETELIYGVALLSLQNYINKCCVDFLEAKFLGYTKKHEYYDLGSMPIVNEINQIRLIIALANYFKHSHDEGSLHEKPM